MGLNNPVALTVPEIQFARSSDNISSSNYQFNFNITGIEKTQIKSITCQLNFLPKQDCMTHSINFTQLTDGDYKISVVLTTQKDVVIESIKIFRKDSTAPTLSVSERPSVLTNQKTARFAFTISDALSSFNQARCAVDTTVFTDCKSPLSLDNMSDGSHTLKIQATDEAKNLSEVYSFTWTVDQSVPTVLLGEKPAALTKITTAHFTFTGANLESYECLFDSGNYAACTSPVDYASLSSGLHKFYVRAKNKFGVLASPATYDWVVDTVAPTAPAIIANVTSQTKMQSIALNFTSEDPGSGIETYEYSQDNAVFIKTASPLNLNKLAAGPHKLKIRAIDKVGNISAESLFSWEIDLAGPTIIFTEKPYLKTSTKSATFSFTVTDLQGVSITQCSWKRDLPAISSAPVDCRSGTVSYDLLIGNYSFIIQAVDTLGNISTSTYAWEITDAPVILSLASSPSANSTCALNSEGKVACWGDNSFGQLGNGTKTASVNPTYVTDLANVKSVSIGATSACALLTNKTVSCWGDNSKGQLGNGTTVASLKPLSIAGLTLVEQITVGDSFACALLQDRTVKCWGDNSKSFVPAPVEDTPSYMVKTPTDAGVTDITQISAGSEALLLLNPAGKVLCFGVLSSRDQLGSLALRGVHGIIANTEDILGAPLLTGYDGNIVVISTTGDIDQIIYAHYEVNDYYASLPKVENVVTGSAKSVASGGWHSCFTDAAKNLKCYGDNSYGQLGTGSASAFASHQIVISPIILTQVTGEALGKAHSCAISKGEVFCWGDNTFGQLANATPLSTMPPAGVKISTVNYSATPTRITGF